MLITLALTQPPSIRSATGNLPLVSNSKLTYAKHFRGLRYFCSLIGDYESLLILSGPEGKTPMPSFVPSMSAKTGRRLFTECSTGICSYIIP